ncbi:unnamed protein product [Amoebophrya sp. A120]|nr:unnamed protein product [Amoebophrya sp. A120]|eukprot:GSA120T00022534001.1
MMLLTFLRSLAPCGDDDTCASFSFGRSKAGSKEYNDGSDEKEGVGAAGGTNVGTTTSPEVVVAFNRRPTAPSERNATLRQSNEILAGRSIQEVLRRRCLEYIYARELDWFPPDVAEKMQEISMVRSTAEENLNLQNNADAKELGVSSVISPGDPDIEWLKVATTKTLSRTNSGNVQLEDSESWIDSFHLRYEIDEIESLVMQLLKGVRVEPEDGPNALCEVLNELQCLPRVAPGLVKKDCAEFGSWMSADAVTVKQNGLRLLLFECLPLATRVQQYVQSSASRTLLGQERAGIERELWYQRGRNERLVSAGKEHVRPEQLVAPITSRQEEGGKNALKDEDGQSLKGSLYLEKYAEMLVSSYSFLTDASLGEIFGALNKVVQEQSSGHHNYREAHVPKHLDAALASYVLEVWREFSALPPDLQGDGVHLSGSNHLGAVVVQNTYRKKILERHWWEKEGPELRSKILHLDKDQKNYPSLTEAFRRIEGLERGLTIEQRAQQQVNRLLREHGDQEQKLLVDLSSTSGPEINEVEAQRRKKAFQQLQLQWHPDKEPDPEKRKIATAVFQLLQDEKPRFLGEINCS